MLRQLIPAAISGGLVATMLSGCGTSGAAKNALGPTPEPPMLLYVAPNGNDAWSGQLAKPNRQKTDGPFATLERARDQIRNLKRTAGLPHSGVTVELRGGVYELVAPFALVAEDSGTEQSPITYRAAKGEKVRLVGGKVLTSWQSVTDPAILARLDPAARDRVVRADLKSMGITDYGQVKEYGLELFFEDRPMTLARWPNEGFTRIVDVVGGQPQTVHGLKGDKVGKFTYDGDRPKRWSEEKDLWLHGYWFWDWADERQKVQSLDVENRTVTLTPPDHYYGYRSGQRFYALNVLAELDQPGEWYLDRDTGMLYFWPPGELGPGRPMVSVATTLLATTDASFVTLRGFTLEAVRQTAVTITGGTHTRLVGCIIRNTGQHGATVSGMENAVIGCDIYETGESGVILSGGDRQTLTPGKNLAENNHIHHFSRWHRTYKPAIRLLDVGNRAAHNLLHDCPHEAIYSNGNDHVIEFNEIHSVCVETGDSGAYHTGRDWSQRGTVLRYNYWHDIKGPGLYGANGVYLDDAASGYTVYGNLFCRVTRAAFIGGGRDNRIENNVFVDCLPAVHVDARGLNWMKYHIDDYMPKMLKAMPYQTPPWSERYPQLLNLLADDPGAPKYNVIARNICVGGKWDEFEAAARPFLDLTDNLLDADPHFVDAEHGNFQLKDDSPAYKLGFQRLPIEKIGLYKDADRASWPVQHQVREIMPPPPEAPKLVPPRFARTGPAPVFKVAHLAATVQVDGTIRPEEWAGADSAQAMPIAQGLDGEKVKPASLAWFACDDQFLYVAVDNAVDPAPPLKPGDQWGRDDAVELAFRNIAAGKDAPILVLRGYPSGHFESSPEAGAPEAAVKKAAEGVVYGARIVDAGRWTTEWKIPFASLGIDPAKQPKFAFNLSVHKTAGPEWVLWQGTRATTWEVGNAGTLELAR